MSLSHANQFDFSNTTFATDYYYTAVLAADVEGLIDPVELYRIAEQTALESVKSMSESDALELLVSNTRIHTKSDPYFAKIAAQVLYKKISIAAYASVGGDITTDTESTSFIKYVNKAVEVGGITPDVFQKFDLERLAAVIDPSKNYLFDYLGLQTLYDRYFLHDNEVRYELPQQFLMRVAMGLCLNEDNPTERAIQAYVDVYSTFNYMSSTPTLFNSCTLHPQMSSCYLTTLADDLYEIYGSFRDNAMLSKWAGGIGNDWTPVRALNAHIKGTNGKSQGIVPFLKVNNDTAVAVNQGGKRKGAIAAYLETFHLDVEEFLELRKNTGDDRRRTHDMNTANWVPDLFMKRMMQGGQWTLFTPNEVPDLHELSGKAFDERYEYYEKNAKELGLMHKVIRAKDLWQKMLSMLFETGHPWLTFKDPCNIRSPQQHVGVVHSSNLCTEITLNTSKDEVAVCNLGSINIVAHINKDGSINVEKLRKTIRVAVRLLDNVIDINYYPIPQAANSNLRHRPIGLGIMGFNDALYIKKVPYSSDVAVEFADEFQELVSYFAIEASADLAQERGSYESFEGSDWSKGILPLDTLRRLEEERGSEYCDFDYTQRLDWESLRAKVKLGMRNSNVMAIAPTATIANICGVSQSIEPTFQNLYVKSNLSGEFTIINKYLVDTLKERGLWSNELSDMLKTLEGDISRIEGMPQDLVDLFATAFQVDPRYLVKAAARRQKWIDQAQSFNMYMNKPNGKKLDAIYKMTWIFGCKTNYYLRALGATTTEKSTNSNTTTQFVLPTTLVDGQKACSILDPDCDACQ